jgi:DNA-binding beta-propeller fold protein YncE
VIDALDGRLYRIDSTTDQIREIHVGGHPVSVAAGAGAVWVADAGSSAVLRIDPDTAQVVARTGTGPAPLAVAVDAGGVWVIR